MLVAKRLKIKITKEKIIRIIIKVAIKIIKIYIYESL